MKQTKQPAVYILASGRNGTFYTGVTSALVQRIWQHREHSVDGFSKEHDVTMLVWYELHGDGFGHSPGRSRSRHGRGGGRLS